MADPLLDSYWEAVRTERYRTHLRRLPARLDRATRRRPAPVRSPHLVWALGALLVVVAAGFLPVPTTATTGLLIAGRTDIGSVSEALGALEALPLPATRNLSVSADSAGTTFAVFLADDGTASAETWTARVEAAVAPRDLRVQAVDVVTDRALWVTLLGHVGVTISASGTTRAEILAQVDRQLDALGSGHADVEQFTGPDGRTAVRITIRDLQ